MGRKGQSITLSISKREKGQLEALAREYGYKWGEKPNISQCRKSLPVCQNSTQKRSKELVAAIQQSRYNQ